MCAFALAAISRKPSAPLFLQAQYMASLGGAYSFIEFNSNSKSGAFFFYSHDGELIQLRPEKNTPVLHCPCIPARKQGSS